MMTAIASGLYLIARGGWLIGVVIFVVMTLVSIGQSFWLGYREAMDYKFEPKVRHFMFGRMALLTWILIATDVCMFVAIALRTAWPAIDG
jgi:hypothetical protein